MIERYVQIASSYGADIDFVFTLIFCVVGFWFIVTEIVFFGFILRFRKKPGVPSQYITGELKSEKRWIVILPALVLLCDLGIMAADERVWFHVKQELPTADQTIRVIGQQWAWSFVHPGADGRLDTADDIATVDTLRLQVGTTYHFKLESRDVLHSFSVPAFRLKQDAIPGRIVTGWFKTSKTGEFDLQCAEICGIGHGIMGARIRIETPEQHAAWIAENTVKSVAAVMPAAGE